MGRIWKEGSGIFWEIKRVLRSGRDWRSKPSKELDLIQIREGNMNYYLSLCDPDILGEVIDFVFDKKPEEEENNILPDDFPDDLNGKKKKGDPDPLDDNPFIPDFE